MSRWRCGPATRVERIHELTHIDRWFLHKIAAHRRGRAIGCAVYAGGVCPKGCPRGGEAGRLLRSRRSAGSCGIDRVRRPRDARGSYGLAPQVKQIDTLAAEYPAADQLPLPDLQRRSETTSPPAAGRR